MSKHNPPKWPLRFLHWFCKEESQDEIEGDLHEMFQKRSKTSVYKAKFFFYWNVLRSMRRMNMKTVQINWPVGTISFIQTVRFLRRDGVYSLLNALSLCIGFSLTLLFVWYANTELSFDQFHSKKDRIYRVSFDQYMDMGSYATTPYPVGPAIKEDYPEVLAMTRFASAGRMPVKYEDKAFFEKIKLADEDFFQVFDFPLLLGNPASALKDHHQVVISETLSKKYFKDENPIGKQLIIGADGSYNATVTGVYQDMPANSQIQVDIILSYETLHQLYPVIETLWRQMPGNYTYLLLNDESKANPLQRKLTQLKDKYVSELERGGYDFRLIPLVDVHFYEGLYNENSLNRSFKDLVVFGMVIGLILLISIMNFANLTSSRYLTRIKEVGVRKVIGAGKTQLLFQFLFQSFMMVVLAMILAYAVMMGILPYFNEFAVTSFEMNQILQPVSLMSTCVLIVGVTLIAGIIPAIKLASLDVARQAQNGLSKAGQQRTKSYFLIFQYLATFILMVSSMVMYEQLHFLESRLDLGEEERIVVPINKRLSEDMKVLQAALEAYPSILATGASSHVPSFYGDSWPVRRSLEDTPVQTENFVITEDYPEVMSYQLLAGRMLNGDLQSDIDGGYVINETCATMLGFESYEEAIGKTLYFGSDEPKKGKIIGIAKDFHFDSFREKISPALFQFQPYEWMNYKFLVIKVPIEEAVHAIEAVEIEIGKIDPDWVIDASFFEDHFKQRYLQETNQGKLATSLTLIAIILTCLGQIGLILHYVLSRQKEMAVRKVLGASVQQLWSMMTRSYVLMMGLSIALAIPVCIYFLTEWLSTFYYRIPLGPKPFILATVAAGFIVVSVITSIALNAARKNPVESLVEE